MARGEDSDVRNQMTVIFPVKNIKSYFVTMRFSDASWEFLQGAEVTSAFKGRLGVLQVKKFLTGFEGDEIKEPYITLINHFINSFIRNNIRQLTDRRQRNQFPTLGTLPAFQQSRSQWTNTDDTIEKAVKNTTNRLVNIDSQFKGVVRIKLFDFKSIQTPSRERLSFLNVPQ